MVTPFARTQQTSLLRLSCAPPLGRQHSTRPYATKASSHKTGRSRRPTDTSSHTNSPSLHNASQNDPIASSAEKSTRLPPPPRRSSLSVPAEARYNQIGIQQISSHVHPQLFPVAGTRAPDHLVELSKDHLRRHDLLGKNTDKMPPVGLDLPQLQGATLDEHFYKLGMDSAEPYLTLAKRYAFANPPPKPRKWIARSGWTKYNQDGSSEPVDAPDEEVLTFDTEVLWHESAFPVMACAVSDTTWYAWLSPWLLGESPLDRHLIPLGDPKKPRIVIGHNIGYDRARIAEEYDLVQSSNNFIDTMSLHVAAKLPACPTTWACRPRVSHTTTQVFGGQANMAAEQRMLPLSKRPTTRPSRSSDTD